MNKQINSSNYHSDSILKENKKSFNKQLFKNDEIKVSDIECTLICNQTKTGENR